MSLCPLHAATTPCALCEAITLQVAPSIIWLNEDQWADFMHNMQNPKPPTPAMIEAARKMVEWVKLPGDREYDSWGKA